MLMGLGLAQPFRLACGNKIVNIVEFAAIQCVKLLCGMMELIKRGEYKL